MFNSVRVSNVREGVNVKVYGLTCVGVRDRC